ncbi:helix-turn-helix domain-containing protein [Brevibacterium picturae]|uniref:helix-turn-helix domain-containing protein n=1 Tax=Brevibacterium picturae TaxID=260553 RepID=UPI003D155774
MSISINGTRRHYWWPPAERIFIKADELAERAGISRSTLQKIERGDSGVSIGAVLSVMQALGQLDHIAEALDPLSTDLGRLRSTESLPKRVRR